MRAQDLPVKFIIIAGLGIFVLITATAMFVIGMRGASQQTNIVNATQADCQRVCGSLSVSAHNYVNCPALKQTPSAKDYSSSCTSFGPCRVILSTGDECSI